jgi:hypothetical protein
MANVSISVKISDALRKKISQINSPTTMLAIHNNLAKRCDPYVPFMEGALSQTTVITSKSVKYIQPYARYQYYGEVYGPNIPIKEHGEIVGWFSPPGKPKHPTGRKINYTTDYHPLATSFWDKAMLRDHRDEFNKEVENIIKWRLI